jgi:serine/threonine-protein kinase
MNIPVPDAERLSACLNAVEDLQFVARGGFKVVFRGTVEGRTEAVKVIYLPGEAEGVAPELTAQLVARARREIAALGECESPALVKLGSLDPEMVVVDGMNYLAYSEEFLPGEPLSQAVTQPPSTNYPELWTVFSDLLLLIEELSLKGYLHRDIKPANIMATGSPDRPYVALDMGIAYKMDATQLTQGVTPPGTTRYMPPELLQPGYKDVMDFRCDVYSLGLSVYELASGVHPYAPYPEQESATVYRIMNVKPDRLETLRPDLPPHFCQIVDRCMRKKIALRYGRIDLLKQEVEGVAP